MRLGIVAIGVLAAAATVFAQPPGPPRGGRGMGMGMGGPGGFLGAEVLSPGRLVKGAPFSGDVVTTSTQTLADGSHIKQSTTVHVYRDGEGRTRREETLNLNGLAQMVFLNDPVAHTSYAMDMTNRTATMTARGRMRPGGPPEFAGGGMRRAWSDQNVKTESLGTQMMDGLQAQGTRTTRTIPAGQIGNEQPIQIVTESWYSPELQMVVLRKSSDPRRGETVTQLMNVSRGEPASTLFQVPVDFKVTQGRGPRPRN